MTPPVGTRAKDSAPIVEHESHSRRDVRYDGRTKDNDPRTDEQNVAGLVERPPEPGEESAGPAMFDLIQKTRRALEVNNILLDAAAKNLEHRTIVESATGTTDANGNVDIPIYTVPSGYEFICTRWTVEDGVHTPAAGFTNAAAFLILYSGRQFKSIQNIGSIRDFLPNPPAAGGVVIPAIVTDGATQAAYFRGNETVALFTNLPTLVGADIFVRIQGLLRPI